MVVRSFESYLRHLTAEVRKHGRAAIQDADDPGALRLGFKSPTGIWQIGLNVVKAEFSKGQPWRENTSLIENYKKLGGKAGLSAMTQVPPAEEFARLYQGRLRAAIAEGERLRAMH